jgi:hypothetical protein
MLSLTKGSHMDFPTSIKTCFSKYVDFKGVASRSEYWYFALFTGLAQILISTQSPSLAYLFELGVVLPSIAVGVRRMHDRNLSGWWILLPIFNLVQACMTTVPTSRWSSGTFSASGQGRACPNGHSVPDHSDNYCPSCGAPLSQ